MPLSEQQGTTAKGRPCRAAYSMMTRVAPSGCMPTTSSASHGSSNVKMRWAYVTGRCLWRRSKVVTARPRRVSASLRRPCPPATSKTRGATKRDTMKSAKRSKRRLSAIRGLLYPSRTPSARPRRPPGPSGAEAHRGQQSLDDEPTVAGGLEGQIRLRARHQRAQEFLALVAGGGLHAEGERPGVGHLAPRALQLHLQLGEHPGLHVLRGARRGAPGVAE